MRHAIEVIGRAVERIDVPRPARPAGHRVALLGHDRVIRECGADASDHETIGVTVGVGDEVRQRGLRRDAGRRSERALKQECTSLARQGRDEVDERGRRRQAQAAATAPCASRQ